jgi:hypothetical protein
MEFRDFFLPRNGSERIMITLVRGEDTLAGPRGGWAVHSLEDARHCSVLYLCKYLVLLLNFLCTGSHRVVISYDRHAINKFLIGLLSGWFFFFPTPLPNRLWKDMTGSSILLYLPPVDHAPVLPHSPPPIFCATHTHPLLQHLIHLKNKVVISTGMLTSTLFCHFSAPNFDIPSKAFKSRV